MLTSNILLGYVLTRGGGQAIQGGLSCAQPRISVRIDNPQILLHQLLQEYLVERDINFISVNLRCLLQTFSWVMYWQGVGGQAVQGSLSCPPPRISERIHNPQILLHHSLQEYLVERDINIIQSIWDAYFKGSVGLHIDKGWWGKVSRAVCLAPRPKFQREWIISNFYYIIYFRNI